MFLRSDPAESFLFRLHYKVTFPFLLICSLLVAFNVFYGTPMSCISQEDGVGFMTSYCWSHGTFSMIDAMDKEVGFEVPYPGVDKGSANNDAYVYHTYYKWIYIILLVQAVLFYLPKALWTYLKGDQFQEIANHLHRIKKLPSYDNEDHERSQKLRSFSSYLSRNRGNFNAFAYYYHLCETICCFNVIFQLVWLNFIFNGDFFAFGSRLGQSYGGHLFSILPMLAKCRFHRYGRSGDVQRHDLLCNLPVNALTEKIYVFILFWFLFLLALGCLGFAKSVLTNIFWKVRQIRLRWAIGIKKQASVGDKMSTDAVIPSTGFGDWFMLSVVSRHLNNRDFNTLLSNIDDSTKNSASSGDGFDAV